MKGGKVKRMTKNNEKSHDLNFFRETGRVIGGSYYDHQLVRIQENNRFRDIVIRKAENMGIVEPSEEKEDKDKHQNKYKDSEIKEIYAELKEEGKFSDEEKELLDEYEKVRKNAEKYEKEYEKLMKKFVEREEVFNKFLKHISGISAVISSNFLKEFGYCREADYISSLWKYCGMHVKNGKAPKRKKGDSLEFSIKRRTMVWKAGDCLLKNNFKRWTDEFGNKHKEPLYYRRVYDKEKEKQLERMENSKCKYCGETTDEHYQEKTKHYCSKDKEQEVTLSDFEIDDDRDNKKRTPPWRLGHAHNRALRKMIKMFLAHYWMACKDLTNQEKPKPYPHQKQNHKTIVDWKDVVEEATEED